MRHFFTVSYTRGNPYLFTAYDASSGVNFDQGQDHEGGSLGAKLHDGAGIGLGESGANLVEDRFTGQLSIHACHGPISAGAKPACHST